jgi:threonine/homoserine/homoserine lactone efflux protein
MQDLPALLGIVTALTAGVISPGPSFVLIARTAVSSSRAEGVAAALGMGGGGVLFAMAALLGLNAVLLAVPSLYLALRILGGLYLAYLGIRIWRSAGRPLLVGGIGSGKATTKLKSLLLGLTTQVSNPKTAVVYASVFAAFMPAAQTFAFSLALIALVFTIESGWYTLVALAVSSERPRVAYLRSKALVDRIGGGVMVALGLKLASSAYRG